MKERKDLKRKVSFLYDFKNYVECVQGKMIKTYRAGVV